MVEHLRRWSARSSPSSRRASVVLPLPLSPTIGGDRRRLVLDASARSRPARRVCASSNRPPPKTLVTCRASSSAVIAGTLVRRQYRWQATQRSGCDLAAARGRSTAQRVHGLRAARMERAAGRRARAATAAARECPGTRPSARATAGWRSAAGCTGAAARRRCRAPAPTSTSSPGVHDAEPIDELGHQAHVVADQDDRRAQLAPALARASP